VSCDDPAPKDTFSVLSDQVPGGVLLSMANVGDETILVGGQLDQGKGVIAHYDGTSVCYEENASDRALWWIHSARPGEFYAVGEAGTIIHSVNGERTIESVSTSATLYGVWDSGDRVIAVGGVVPTNKGEIWIRNDGTWTQLASDLPGVAFKIWNNWIVGDNVAYHLDAGPTPTLEERFPPANTKFLTVSGRSDDEVFAVGGTTEPILMSWDGSAWQDIAIDPACASGGIGLNGLWTDPGESLYIAGFNGVMGELGDDGKWNCAQVGVSYEHFHTVNRVGDEVLWSGGNMFDISGNYGTIARYGKDDSSVTATLCE